MDIQCGVLGIQEIRWRKYVKYTLKHFMADSSQEHAGPPLTPFPMKHSVSDI